MFQDTADMRGWEMNWSARRKNWMSRNYQSGITKNHISSMTEHSISLFCV